MLMLKQDTRKRLSAVVDARENDYCGPVVIAGATGISLETVRRLTGNQPMSSLEVKGVLEELGVECLRDFRQLNEPGPWWESLPLPTLGQWLRAGYAEDGAVHMVPLRNHLVAVAGGEVMDNGKLFSPIPEPVELRALRSRRRLSNTVWLKIP